MKVAREALAFARGLAKDQHPEEILGLLRERDGVVAEVLLSPDTTSGERQVFYREESMPIDQDVVGSIHSHPNGDTRPSAEDEDTFSSSGQVHIILGAPYGPTDWTAYDREGEEIEVEIVEDEFDDEWRRELESIDDFEEGDL